MRLTTTIAKARYHLERAEYWQSEVDTFEKQAEEKAVKQLDGRMKRNDGLEADPGYLAGALLRDHHGYKTAVGNRNSHQRQAEIYCLAQMAGIAGTSWTRTEDGLAQIRD
jgi:hypothetical protein